MPSSVEKNKYWEDTNEEIINSAMIVRITFFIALPLDNL
ncbi:hypothetical protein ADU37_CDS18750 [Thermococcus sp. 2319x1]|nr:hypothetical protein ADU37_CDS18750 [Thermococcus sp. 2319x1]